MDNEKIFKTKTGFCHILPDKIILTRDGIRGNMANIVNGKTITRSLILYSIIAAGLFYSAFCSYKNAQMIGAFLSGLLGLLIVYSIVKSLNNSASPVIDRNKIIDVNFKEGASGITRSRFEIRFENEEGKIKKRLIILPGILENGSKETAKAIQLMKDEKLISA